MKTNLIPILFPLLFLASCQEEDLTYQPVLQAETYYEDDPIQQYFKQNFLDPFGSYVAYDYQDKYVDITKIGVPPRREVLIPIGDLIKTAWIEPYNQAADEGEAFLHQYFPKEIILLGSSLRNPEGTVTLGIAESGVRMTFANINQYDPKAPKEKNKAWVDEAFRTLHHEFTHIIDQNFRFDPQPFLELSEDKYTSPNTWTRLTLDQAVSRGMVTPYGTSNPAEDFAELLAYIITSPPDHFSQLYLTEYPCNNFIDPNHTEYDKLRAEDNYKLCQEVNAGRRIIQKKYELVKNYFRQQVGVDLLELRDTFLEATKL